MFADNVAVPGSTHDEWKTIHSIGSKLRSTFDVIQKPSAVFSPACIGHEVITKLEWTEVVVDGVTLPDALSRWSSSLPDATAAAVTTTNLQISRDKIIPEQNSNEVADNSRQQ